ncbi:MAG: TIGR00341 family protein [Actinomycetia bacterium]|nr:TIGR00341 family protein [Actinomycetes bacterium]
MTMDEPEVTSHDDSHDIGDYFNHTTLRGALYLAAGLVALAIPNASKFLLGLTVALVLIGTGASDIHLAMTTKPRRWLGASLGILYIVSGVALVATTDKTLRVITIIIGAIAVARGLAVAWSAVRRRSTRDTWRFDFVRGLLFIVAGIVVVALPESVIAGLIFAAAGAAIIVGAIIMSFGIMHADEETVDPLEVGGYIRTWLDQRDLGDEMRDNVVDSLYFEPPDSTQKQVGFWVLLVLSTAIATLGVIADSTAVVIGAMLVAPLMTPIMGVSAGIVNGWMRRVTTSFATIAGGVGVSIGVAWIVAAWTPQIVSLSANSQIQSRISPTLVDMLIAVAAGAAGAYATVDKRVSSSITGVAIAVALVPPLGVVGITLHAGAYSDASGAFLLFLTNLVSIILMASAVFVVTGLVPIEQFKLNRVKMRTVISTVTLGAMVILLPLVFASEGIIASAGRQSTAQETTEEWISESGLNIEKLEVSTDVITVVLSGEGDVPSVSELESDLETALKTDVTVLVDYFPAQRFTSDDS